MADVTWMLSTFTLLVLQRKISKTKIEDLFNEWTSSMTDDFCWITLRIAWSAFSLYLPWIRCILLLKFAVCLSTWQGPSRRQSKSDLPALSHESRTIHRQQRSTRPNKRSTFENRWLLSCLTLVEKNILRLGISWKMTAWTHHRGQWGKWTIAPRVETSSRFNTWCPKWLHRRISKKRSGKNPTSKRVRFLSNFIEVGTAWPWAKGIKDATNQCHTVISII